MAHSSFVRANVLHEPATSSSERFHRKAAQPAVSDTGHWSVTPRKDTALGSERTEGCVLLWAVGSHETVHQETARLDVS